MKSRFKVLDDQNFLELTNCSGNELSARLGLIPITIAGWCSAENRAFILSQPSQLHRGGCLLCDTRVELLKTQRAIFHHTGSCQVISEEKTRASGGLEAYLALKSTGAQFLAPHLTPDDDDPTSSSRYRPRYHDATPTRSGHGRLGAYEVLMSGSLTE